MILTDYDVALRQAIYFEYLKENGADAENARVRLLFLGLLTEILASGIDFTVRNNKNVTDALLATIKNKFGADVIAHNQAMIKDLFDMLGVSADVTAQNYVAVQVANKAVDAVKVLFDKQKQAYRLRDTLFSGSKVSQNKLWRQYVKGVTPGVGTEPLNMVKDLGNSIVKQSTQLVKQAIVEKLPMSEIIKRIKGDPKKDFKDGLINKVGNQAKSVVRTIGSSIGNFINNKVGALLYDQYQWISTIDGVTTTICRSRHLNVYTYGSGPVPPAHINCRSIIVGIGGGSGGPANSNNTGATYYDWLISQPDAVRSDVLTPAEAEAFRTGKAKRADFTAFRNHKRLTASQFEGKVNKMQTPTKDI